MEGKGAARPPWLGFAVHVYNSIAAWADLLLARPRTFRCLQQPSPDLNTPSERE